MDTEDYYRTYHGHEVEHLDIVYKALRKRHTNMIFLAGDSSLDNKVWFKDTGRAINGYEDVLQPPTMKKDVCYWLNSEAVRRKVDGLGCINTAVEATALSDRARRDSGLLPQDEFIRDHITDNDYLVVSIGGNDIALKPVPCTILNMLTMVRCVPHVCLKYLSCGCLPFFGLCGGAVSGCGCSGCARSLVTCSWPPGLGYFIDMFGNVIQSYVRKIVGKRRPKKVLVCMIYYPDVDGPPGWADTALGALDYNNNPAKLQSAIRAVFRLAVKRISIPGTEVVACPLFETLDGTNTEDYVARVEPSVQGGQKMAVSLLDLLLYSSDEGARVAAAAPAE